MFDCMSTLLMMQWCIFWESGFGCLDRPRLQPNLSFMPCRGSPAMFTPLQSLSSKHPKNSQNTPSNSGKHFNMLHVNRGFPVDCRSALVGERFPKQPNVRASNACMVNRFKCSTHFWYFSCSRAMWISSSLKNPPDQTTSLSPSPNMVCSKCCSMNDQDPNQQTNHWSLRPLVVCPMLQFEKKQTA